MGTTSDIAAKEASAHRLCNQDFGLLSESAVQGRFIFNCFSFETKILTENNAQVLSEVDNRLVWAPDLKKLSKHRNIEMNTRVASHKRNRNGIRDRNFATRLYLD